MQSGVDRARDYRRRAAELRELAAREPEGSIVGDQLKTVADQYEVLARQAELERW